MKESIKNFLEFNGNPMYFTYVDGEWWIALKPICEAMSVDWKNQKKRINDDPILGAEGSIQTLQVEGNQGRGYLCLPEFFVYGWVFQIRSESEKLAEYKWECYRILYEYFHGTVTQRKELLFNRKALQKEQINLLNQLGNNPSYVRLHSIEKTLRKQISSLKKMDEDLMKDAPDLFNK